MSLLFKLGRKGIINFVEAILVIIIIFIAFAVLFPGLNFKSRWDDATTILSARDALITMDRMNSLYVNSFNANSLQNFIDAAIPVNRTSLVAWSSVEGTVKNTVVVACNCSDAQIQNMTYWFSGMEINGRQANIVFVESTLENINTPSDLLLIWGNTNLDTPAIFASLLNYMNAGGGIVEINDFTSSAQTPANGAQQRIFGLTYTGTNNFNDRAYADHFSRKPANTSDIIYSPFKYFFHVPAPFKTFETVNTIPVVSGVQQPSCSPPLGHGNFTLNDSLYNFWICNSSTVYFDTSADGLADTGVNIGMKFNLINVSTNFTLQYINVPSQIGVVFGPNHQFKDFLISWTAPPGSPCPQGNAWGQFYTDQVAPVDNNLGRIAFNASFTKQQLIDLPAVILNNSGGRAAWIADFTAIPDFAHGCVAIPYVSDDHKMLLASLIFWASNKMQSAVIPTNIRTGLLVPYVNVQNNDTYEVYDFLLGLGSPFGS